MKRYVIVLDPGAVNLAAKKIEAEGIKVEQKMDLLNTIVVSGNEEKIKKLAGKIESIKSIEEEGNVSTM